MNLPPDRSAEELVNEGLQLAAQNELAQAADRFEQALKLKPDLYQAYNNLATTQRRLGELNKAAGNYAKALKIKTDDPDIYANLGETFVELNLLEPARKALNLAAKYGLGELRLNCNLFYIDILTGKFAEAEALLKPILNHPEIDWAKTAYMDVILDYAVGRLAPAEEKLAALLKARPNEAIYHFKMANIFLIKGDFKRGWPEFEWRRRVLTKLHKSKINLVDLPQPFWDGSPLNGKTILVQDEQGIGDTIHFVRYLPLVKARGGQTIFACVKSLVGLLSGSPGIDRVINKEKLPELNVNFDVQAAVMSLPYIFRTDLSNIPANVPYLQATERLKEKWRRRLAADKNFKIGISWTGNPENTVNYLRSCPAVLFAPLARLPGVSLYSLQKGEKTGEQLKELQKEAGVTDLSGELTDFTETAAAIENLDLVISVDTAVAHLAGALSRPVWIMIPLVPDYRWLLNREDSPWYPTMKLFRQKDHGNWEELFARVRRELEKLRG
jgi:tetratricopeptide (TPR) repeat protein